MAAGKSKKNIVIFNSLMWATIGGFLIGLVAAFSLLGKPLNLMSMISIILSIAMIFGAGKGLHSWWGK